MDSDDRYLSTLKPQFDLFYPDCIDLAAKARAAGVPVALHLRRGQPHNYAAMPMPEGREARAILDV